MDLEARVRSLFAAISARDADAILGHVAEGARVQVQGHPPMGRADLEGHARAACGRVREVTFHLGAIVPRRNVTFVEWRAHGTMAEGRAFATNGVHVLSWDQDGHVAHATVHADAGPLGLPW